MEPVAIVIALALVEYLIFGMLVGRARVQANVQAPATSGDPSFERHFRVQQNTLEQLIIFIPAMLLFGTYVDPNWAAALGLVFIVGRFLYYRGYVETPEKRSTGFLVGSIAQVVLLLGGIVGAVISWL
jgi:uncharacterized membrane protein YecN with MAPEG domain